MPMVARRRTQLRVLAAGLLVAGLVASGVPATAATPEGAGELSGLVTAEGRPLPGVLVTMTPEPHYGQPAGPPALAVTDETGRYRFANLPDQAVTVHVRGPQFSGLVDTWWPGAYSSGAASTIEISGSAVTADVDLPRGGSAGGSVVDASTGVPVPGARVTAGIPGDPTSAAVGDVGRPARAGAFALTRLPPVALQLVVELPPGSPYLPPAQDPSRGSEELIIDGSAATSGLTIGVRRGAEIRGRVTDDSGAPLAGTTVRLRGCAPTCPAPATTDATGAYRLVGVPPGSDLRVVAVPGPGLLGPSFPNSGLSTPIDRPRVEAGDVIDSADITLTRAAFLTVEVQGLRGDLPVPAVLQLITEGRIYNQYVSIGADSDLPDWAPGDPVPVRVGPVPPGRYALRIRPGLVTIGQLPTRWVSTARDDAPPTIELSAGVETDVVVRLGAGDGVARWSSGEGARWPAAALDDPGSGPGPDRAAAHGTTSPPPTGGWPGLRAGFLAPEGWSDPYLG